MAEFKEISPNAPAGEQAAQLGRQPLPADQALERAVGQVLRAEELQLLVLLRLAGDAGAGDPDRHRHLPGDALQARCGAGVRVGRVHHARRALGLADPLHALHRRLGVLHRGLPAHVPRADLRQLPQAARADLDLRLRDLPVPDGRGLHGLPAALGPDVLLGRAGDREPVRRHSRSSAPTWRC